MKKSLFLLALFVFMFSAFGQQFRRGNQHELPPRDIGVYIDHHVIGGDSLYQVTILYAIRNDLLVFKKNEDTYSAGISFWIEFIKDEEVIRREIQEKETSTTIFAETNAPDKYIYGVMNVQLPKGTYNAVPVLTDKNSDREAKLPPLYIACNDDSLKQNLHPLFVYTNPIVCADDSAFVIVNKSGDIPFTNKDISVLFPYSGTVPEDFSLSIKSNGKSDTFSKAQLITLGFPQIGCDQIIAKSDEGGISYLKFDSVNANLQPGVKNFTLKESSDTKQKGTTRVHWYESPRSLRNPELAVKVLRYIEDEEVVDSIDVGDARETFDNLFKYWKRFDPTPQTAYNELMEEFYSRVDFVNREFQTISGNDGAVTDRGAVYIKYGKPTKKERAPTKNGRVTEIWHYQRIDKKFVFVDYGGKGDFLLEKIL